MTITTAADYHFSIEATPFGGKVVGNSAFVQVVLNLNDEDQTVTFDGTNSNITADAAAPVVLEAARFIRRENVWGMVAKARVRREALQEMRLEDEDRQALEDERRLERLLFDPS